MKSLKILSLSLLCLGALAVRANATLIVDTGTPNDSIGWSFFNGQYFGAEFSVASATQINSIEGFFGNQFGSAGNVAIALHSDGGNVPGSVLFSSNLALGSGAALGWHGLSGLNWNIGAGSFWVSFMPDTNIEGTMPGTAPSPVGEYAQGYGNYNWSDAGANGRDYLAIGVRIDAGSSAVPESASLSLWGIVGVAGLVARRLYRRN